MSSILVFNFKVTMRILNFDNRRETEHKKASNSAITDARIATIIGDKNIFLNPDGRAKQQGIGFKNVN